MDKMHKRYLISATLMVALTVITGFILMPKEAKCWGNNCQQTTCNNDYNCGYSCFCYKQNTYQLKGTCVPKQQF